MITNSQVDLFDGFTLDAARGCVSRLGEPIHLRPQTYEVLKYLAENRGILISKDKLIEHVWQGRAVTDGSLGKCIEEMREALGPAAWVSIRNVRGRGYILDPEGGGRASQEIHSEKLEVVSLVVEDEPSPLVRGSSGQAKKHMRSAVTIVSGAVIAIAATALIYVNYFLRPSANINSIAVLPFVNVTADPNDAYVSDGLAESLIDELAKLPGLKVIARTSSFTYKGRAAEVQDVGRSLGVRAVVMGTIERRGEDLIVSAQLVDAQDRSQLWGGRYLRRITDLERLQAEISGSIWEKLRPDINVAQTRQSSRVTTANPQAYEFYLNGLFHLHQGTDDGIKTGLDYLNQAVLIDPNFARAWAAVSRANAMLGGNSLSNPRDTHVKARAAAERALELDDTLAEAHLALGRLEQDEWDWAAADKAYKRAIELGPSLTAARLDYSQFLATMMRHSEALNEIKRAQELDPMSIPLKRREAWLLYLARRGGEGIALLQGMGPASSPGVHRALGFMYEASGSPEQAVKEFRHAIAIDGENTGNLCYLAGALAVAGRKKEALEIVDRLNRTKEYVSPTELAAVYARLKDTERAVKLLEKAYAEHDLQLQFLNLDPFFDNVRSDPRFQELVRRVGVPSPPDR
jgi:TolB-like protein/DNA-binding winged helix-turn-helix (wHTH) protein